MRVRKGVLVMLAGWFFAAGWVAAAVNVLADGDVEDGRAPSAPGIPGWARAGNFVVADGEGVNGSKCLKANLVPNQSQQHFAQNQKYYCRPGDQITLKLAYKTSADFNNQNQINDNRVLVRFWDEFDNFLGRIRIQLAPTNGQWVVAQDTITAPDYTDYFEVIVLAAWDGYSTGTLWVDDVEVYQVFGTTPTAGIVYWEGVAANPDSSNWNVSNNWSVATQSGLRRPPASGDIAIVANQNLATVSPVIDREVFSITALGVAWHGGTAAYPKQKLYITDGGALTVSAWMRLGNDPGTEGRLFMDGGTLNCGTLFLGNDADNTHGVGLVYQTGGVVNLGGMYISDYSEHKNKYYFGGDATLTMDGDQQVGIPVWFIAPLNWAWNIVYDSGANKTTATVSYQPISGTPETSFYWNGTVSAAWTNGANWSGGVVPGTAGAPNLAIITSNGSPNYPVISTDLNAAGTSPTYIAFNWHDTCPVNTATLTVGAGGYLACSAVFFNRDSGTAHNPGDAALIVQEGGRMVANDILMSNNPDSKARIIIRAGSYLHCANPINWGGGDHQIDIQSGGRLFFSGDITAAVQQWIAEGKIVGDGGQTTVQVSYNTPIAGLTCVYAPCAAPLDGDFNGDCIVDTADLMLMASEWLQAPITQWFAEMDVDPVTLPNFYRRPELSYANDYEIGGGIMTMNPTAPSSKGDINALVDTYPPQVFNKPVEIWASMRAVENGDPSPAVRSPSIFVPVKTDQATFGMARFMLVKPTSSQQDLVLVVNENTEALRLSGFDATKMVAFNAVVDPTGANNVVTIKSATDGVTTYNNQTVSFANGLSGPAGPTFVSLAGFGYQAEVDYFRVQTERTMLSDLTGDNFVNLLDFAELASEWLE